MSTSVEQPVPMGNIKLTIAYDGTDFLGWQKTGEGPSIEGSLEKALQIILKRPIPLQAASRTDAGVHAEAQVVNFLWDGPIDAHTLDKLRGSLNGLLPQAIAVLQIESASESFHPTLDCTGKEYRYAVCHDHVLLPHRRRYTWHFPHPLDIDKIRLGAECLIGEKDFTVFCTEKKNCGYKDYVRRIDAIKVVVLPENYLRFEVRGNNFLYKMVRTIVGTLIHIGCGKIKVEDLPAILASGDRTRAGVTAPAHGLCLQRVMY